MKKVKGRLKLLVSLLILILGVTTFGDTGQGKPYDGPDDPAGDIAAERAGYMAGNNVLLYFRNTTELSDWVSGGAVGVSRWPNNLDGTTMLDGVGLLIGARVFVKDDTIPVTNPVEIQQLSEQGVLDTLNYLQTSYREEMDTDPTGTVEWGLYPVFGYFNEADEYPAMSNLPNTWPAMGWPAGGDSTKWTGEWNGRFGRGVIYADMECYFVTNDAHDQEYLGPEDVVRYYPRPGVKIGDKKQDVTIQAGKPWGGVGVRVETRGFQWNNPQARNAIFWEYTIANISDYDLPQMGFGYWVDNGIGGDQADDEYGYFDKYLNLAYSWDKDGTGRAGLMPGVMGFAYLESPGLAYDNIDNDDDGLLDEKRDNIALTKVGPTDGIHDLNKFLEYYNYKVEDLREHWDADEDQDWQDGQDLNGDGIYQLNEEAGDDVGLDGVGPGELNYTGPDEGECDHMPSFNLGAGCEPNFAATDVSESDMVGLTAFKMFPIPSHASEERWFRGDRSMCEMIFSDTLEEFTGSVSNLVELFASGPFPLYKGRTERISMSIIHTYDELTGLNSDEHSAPVLYESKRIVQVIYEKDYRFAQPPKMPTLTATPGDGKVILTWDNVADKLTRDPFVGNENDFEGYKVYRATDKKFQDAEVITDLHGIPTYKKPIFQCDIKDERKGYTDFGLINGIGYYLGDDGGLTHYFEDNTVQNGKTYYYGLVAYDYGVPEFGKEALGITPSENNLVVDLNEAEEIRFVGKNVQVVTPRQDAAGYLPPNLEVLENSISPSAGTVTPQLLAKNSLRMGHTYKIKFLTDTSYQVKDVPYGLSYTTSGFQVFDVTDGDRIVYTEDSSGFAQDNLSYSDSLKGWTLKSMETVSSDVFEGMSLDLFMKAQSAESGALDVENSGWKVGNSLLSVTPAPKGSRYYPWEYNIIFTGDQQVYTTRTTTKSGFKDENNDRVRNILTDKSFSFYTVNTTFTDSTGSYLRMDMVVQDVNEDGSFNMLEDRVFVGVIGDDMKWKQTVFVISFYEQPNTDDVYKVVFQRPFFTTDSLTFVVNPAEDTDKKAMKATMDDIKVVPNPYIATNSMEPSLANTGLNQRRRLLFTHLPARCVIRIFSISGVLVDEFTVENSDDNGTAHWDVLTREGLEVAAGMYIYHVEATETGFEKTGKFAIIK